MNKMPLVSVIVPSYNVANYIDECLDSILSQTYINLQVVCVDDGSTDNTLELLEKRQSHDSRVEIVTIPNCGVSNARNTGMSLAKGEFMMFIDGDDWWDKNLVEACIDSAIQNQSDIVMFSYISEHTKTSLKRDLYDSDKVFTGKELQLVARQLIGPIGEELSNPARLDSNGSACFKLYRSCIVKQFQFVDLKIIGTAEDSLFNMQVFPQCETLSYKSGVYYHYRKTNLKQFTKQYKPQLWKQWQNLYQFIREIPTCDEKALNNRIALNILGLGLNELESNNSAQQIHSTIKEYLSSSNYRDAITSLEIRSLPMHWKLFFYCAKHQLVWPLMGLLKTIHYIINR